MVRVAAVQMDIALAEPALNRRRMTERLDRAVVQGAQLVVFPECSVPGYCFDTPNAARACAETIPGESTEWFAQQCARHQVYVVLGMLERQDERLFNACVLIGPEGVIGTYRKTHLPWLGVDQLTTHGNEPYRVWDTQLGRIGMLICYDLAFPEAARVLALQGADLIVLPTNWPPGGQGAAEYLVPARAIENHVYFLAANRVGHENGFRFIGRSRICAPEGELLAVAGEEEDVVLQADCDFARARNKHIIRVPLRHEIDRLGDRRPELYGPLLDVVTQPSGTPRQLGPKNR